jgi:hypothetical protein
LIQSPKPRGQVEEDKRKRRLLSQYLMTFMVVGEDLKRRLQSLKRRIKKIKVK